MHGAIIPAHNASAGESGELLFNVHHFLHHFSHPEAQFCGGCIVILIVYCTVLNFSGFSSPAQSPTFCPSFYFVHHFSHSQA
jgi:hypothetical protein